MKEFAEALVGFKRGMEQRHAVMKQKLELEHMAIIALKELGKRPGHYSSKAICSKNYFAEIDNFIKTVSVDAGLEAECVYDRCFMLLEALCVVMREGTLASGVASTREKMIMEYFENSGLWNKTDGTLVTEMYYEILPNKYRELDTLEGER